MDFDELDEVLLVDNAQNAVETIAWTVLCDAEKGGILKDICFDLDYICVAGLVSSLLECACVQRLVSASSGSIRSSCYSATVRNRTNCFYLVVAEVGDFRLAIEAENDNEETKTHINAVLDTCYLKSSNITWRQMQEELLSLFAQETVALYRFGQKHDLNSVIDLLCGFSKQLVVNCAIGMEVSYPGHALFACCDGRKNSEFFIYFFLK